MNTLENPARMLYNHLWTYMQGNIVYVALNFNFGDDESVALYHQRLGIVLDSLENGIPSSTIVSNDLQFFSTPIPHHKLVYCT